MTDPVYLPASPRARVLGPVYIDAGGVLRGSHGGAAQPIGRLGDHWQFNFELPVMKWEMDARLWVNSLLKGVIAKKVAIELYMPGFQVGVPGLPVVDGDLIGGSILPIRNATPYYTFQFFQFISIVHEGSRSSHAITEQVTADANGLASLPISPMLRTDLADGDTVEVGQPFLEGYLSGDNLNWSIDEARTSQITFQVEEY